MGWSSSDSDGEDLSEPYEEGGDGVSLPPVKARKIKIGSTPSRPKGGKKKGGKKAPKRATPMRTSALTSNYTPRKNKYPTKRRAWTEEEIGYLIEGVEKFGKGSWAIILAAYPFNSRSNVNLKDKWRSLEKKADK